MHGPWKLWTRNATVLALRDKMRCFAKNFFLQESCLRRSSHIQRCRSFSGRVGPQIILFESQPGKQSSCSKRPREITTEPIAV